MAKTLLAQFRYHILDECFRKKSLTFKELLVYVNNRIEAHFPYEQISIRTLRQDIHLFRDQVNGFKAPLPLNSRTYQYSDKSFSIAQQPLLEEEQEMLSATLELLKRFENNPKYDRLSEALIRIQDEEFQTEDTSTILFFDHNEEYRGIKFLKPLYLAIKNEQVLTITYQGFHDTEPKTYTFHPHVLKQYNRRWFVFGKNENANISEWSIPLDERLLNYEVNETINFSQSNTDWDTFFRTQVGIIRPINAQIERVVLKFFNGREYYFKTKPFHPDYDEFFEEEKANQVWFNTVINRELVQQILSYGKDVEVLEPIHLREKISDVISSMKQNYT